LTRPRPDAILARPGRLDTKRSGIMKTWHEDNAFWTTMAPEMFTEARWAAAPEEVGHVVELLQIEPPARVLDLCCGPGRHSLELARRGFRVTGVDRTAAYLQRARQGARAERLKVEFVKADMRRFRRREGFDAAVNLFTAFGYFEDPEDDRAVLKNVHASLKEGARLVIEMMGKEILARVFRERDWHQSNGAYFLEERRVCKDWTWIENRWILLKGGRKKEFRVCHRLYSAAELGALLKDCGFSEVKAYGDLAGAPYDHQARRLVVVARK
jgi:SAM-dependent methyltransferase